MENSFIPRRISPVKSYTLLEALVECRFYLVPDIFTTEEIAKDKFGRAVSPYSEEACCWCAEGALMAVLPKLLDVPSLERMNNGLDGYMLMSEVYILLDHYISKRYTEAASLHEVNDKYGICEVLALFRVMEIDIVRNLKEFPIAKHIVLDIRRSKRNVLRRKGGHSCI